MKNTIINAVLSIALKDIQSIIAFFGKLEGKLEEFAAAKITEIEQIDQEITHLVSEKSAIAGDLAVAQALRSNVAKLTSGK